MPVPHRGGFYGLLRPAMEAPDSLVNRTIADPGQVATNVGGSALAGLLGLPGDVEQMGRWLINMRAQAPVVGSEPFLPNTERMQQKFGAEPGRPESLVGEIGAPDPTDIMKRFPGLLGMTLFHGTPHKFDMFDRKKIGTGEGGQSSGGLLGVGRPKAQDLQGNNIELPDNFIEEINQTPLFRGLDSNADDGLIDGKYFTDDPSTAYSYTGEGANRRMVRAAPDIKRPYVVDYQGRAKSDRLDRKYIRQARDGDYDAVVFLNIADSKGSGYRGPGNPSLHERALSGVPSTVVIPLSDDAIRDMSSEVIDQVGGGVRASAAQKSAWEQAMERMRSHKSNITITDKTKK